MNEILIIKDWLVVVEGHKNTRFAKMFTLDNEGKCRLAFPSFTLGVLIASEMRSVNILHNQ